MTIQEQFGIRDDELGNILAQKLIKLSGMVDDNQLNSTNARIVFKEVYGWHKNAVKALQQEVK